MEPPYLLDERRGSADLVATEMRRGKARVRAEHDAAQERLAEFEKFLAAAPAATWREAAEKARYLIMLLSGAPAAHDPRRGRLIAAVLADFTRLLELSSHASAGQNPAPKVRPEDCA